MASCHFLYWLVSIPRERRVQLSQIAQFLPTTLHIFQLETFYRHRGVPESSIAFLDLRQKDSVSPLCSWIIWLVKFICIFSKLSVLIIRHNTGPVWSKSHISELYKWDGRNKRPLWRNWVIIFQCKIQGYLSDWNIDNDAQIALY